MHAHVRRAEGGPGPESLQAAGPRSTDEGRTTACGPWAWLGLAGPASAPAANPAAARASIHLRWQRDPCDGAGRLDCWSRPSRDGDAKGPRYRRLLPPGVKAARALWTDAGVAVSPAVPFRRGMGGWAILPFWRANAAGTVHVHRALPGAPPGSSVSCRPDPSIWTTATGRPRAGETPKRQRWRGQLPPSGPVSAGSVGYGPAVHLGATTTTTYKSSTNC